MKHLLLISALFGMITTVSSCANINPSDQEIDNPMVGTAQSGDPTEFEHRE